MKNWFFVDGPDWPAWTYQTYDWIELKDFLESWEDFELESIFGDHYDWYKGD